MGAVLKTLKDNLGADFTPAVEKAWKVTLKIVQETMISDNYEPKEELPEDIAEKLLAVDRQLSKGNTYRNMDSVAITVQNTDRGDLENYGKDASISMRSDRNEDTLRPIALVN